MFRLENKVVLITGGTSGIGLSYGNELLQEGIKALVIVDIDKSGQNVADELIKKFGERVLFIESDASNSTKLNSAFLQAIEKYNQLDIVINNAGILDEINWPKMVNINLNATIQGTYLAMERYLPIYKSGDEAVVINTASILGIDFDDSIPYYTATKHAVVGLGRSLGTEFHYERTKVRVLTICPGVTMTSFLRINPTKSIEHVSQFSKMIRYKKQNAEDVGKALINVINEGKNGSVWVIENGPPAYEVTFPSREEMIKKKTDPKLA